VAAGWVKIKVKARPDVVSHLTFRVERGGITSMVQATRTINPLATAPVDSYVSGLRHGWALRLQSGMPYILISALSLP
jgi:hypothetical protein